MYLLGILHISIILFLCFEGQIANILFKLSFYLCRSPYERKRRDEDMRARSRSRDRARDRGHEDHHRSRHSDRAHYTPRRDYEGGSGGFNKFNKFAKVFIPG